MPFIFTPTMYMYFATKQLQHGSFVCYMIYQYFLPVLLLKTAYSASLGVLYLLAQPEATCSTYISDTTL